MLHEVEAKIDENREVLQKLDAENLRNFLEQYRLSKCLDEDIDILKMHLNENFFENDKRLAIEPDRIHKIEKQVMSELPKVNHLLLLQSLKRLRYTPFSVLLNHYPDYVNRLALRLGKWVNPVKITGADVLVDKELFKELARSLVHLFRNAVDHGIEPVEERIESGKEEFGNIELSVQERDGTLFLELKDDGRGINVQKVLEKAEKKELITKEILEKMSEAEKKVKAFSFVFTDNFSTVNEATILSGRGVGLSSLRRAVEDLSGTIEIDSRFREGTCFRVRIPLNDDIPEEIDANTIMSPVLKNTCTTLKFYGAFFSDTPTCFEEADRVALYSISSFIPINGLFRATFILTVEESIARELAECFSISQNDPNALSVMEVKDAIAEIANIILGNSIRSMGIRDTGFSIASPYTVDSEKATLDLPGNIIRRCCLTAEHGKVAIYFVIKEN
jgi:two-component system chemotaxis sensor kinase CheA